MNHFAIARGHDLRTTQGASWKILRGVLLVGAVLTSVASGLACSASSGGGCAEVAGSWSVSGCTSDACNITQSGCTISLSCSGGEATGTVVGSSVSFNGSETTDLQCNGTLSGTTLSGTCGSQGNTCSFTATLTSSGTVSGGTASGATSSGGTSSGGTATGGTATGGTATGGTATGGTASGGTASGTATGGTSSGSTTTCGTVTIDGFYSSAGIAVPSTCTSCSTASCCSTGDACDGDPSCVSLMECLGACYSSSDITTCTTNCANTYGGVSGRAFSEAQAELNCVGNNCSTCP